MNNGQEPDEAKARNQSIETHTDPLVSKDTIENQKQNNIFCRMSPNELRNILLVLSRGHHLVSLPIHMAYK